ncbi:MAG: hypothetical protein ACE15C_09075 [Phycisphaerae bacterium]
MSLDIAILDAAGRIRESVSLGVDEHWGLVQLANKLDCPLWWRLSEYYEDAEFGGNEIPALLGEVVKLRSAVQEEPVAGRLEQLAQLLRLAAAERCGVSVIAD